MLETALEPDLPIIDPHHHLWPMRSDLADLPADAHPAKRAMTAAPIYELPELYADCSAGHRILGTVYVEAGSYYRADAASGFAPVGEVAEVTRVAREGESGRFGTFRPCAAIVGHADLRLGDGAVPVLEALAEAGEGRLRGIRNSGAYDPDPAVLGTHRVRPAGLYADPAFRAGFRHLAAHGLSFDAWLIEPQLGELIDLARAFPDTLFVLDHCGGPPGLGRWKGTQGERFPLWRQSIRELAALGNVTVKLGGLGMSYIALPDTGPLPGIGSDRLAEMWRPYLETCIEAFGVDRAMFESNFAVDRWGADYVTLWNAFKRLTAGASAAEKRALYAGTAARVYRIGHLLDGVD